MNVTGIRKHFPLLDTDAPPVYLDSACVTLKPRVVLEAMRAYYEEFPSCGGRSGHRLGQQVTERVAASRNTLKKFLGAKHAHEVLFTRNTTEGINLVAHGIDLAGKTVLTSDKEHNSNLVPWLRRKKQGTGHVVIPTTDGVLDLEALEHALATHSVGLVALHDVSNLDGVVNPVKRITRLAHDYGARILVDGAQGAGHLAVDVRKLGVDFYACSGHKMLGPSGTGMLYVQDEHFAGLQPYALGGDTVEDTWLDRYALRSPPHRYEAGLQDYAGILGLGAAAQLLQKIGVDAVHTHTKNLRAQLVEGIHAFDLRVLGPSGEGILSVIPGKMPAQELSGLLDQHNILVRAGAFCVHSWFNARNEPGAVRFAPYVYTTREEIDTTLRVLRDIAPLL